MRVEVLVALRLHLGLVRSGIARRPVAVAAVELIDDVHAFDDLTKGCEALAVEHSAVVGKVDEDLGRPGARPAGRIGDGAAGVALLDGIIDEVEIVPLGIHVGIAVQAELDDEALQDAEEPRAVEELGLGEFVEPVGAERGPIAVDLDDEVALRRLELDLVDGGSRFFGFLRLLFRRGAAPRQEDS